MKRILIILCVFCSFGIVMVLTDECYSNANIKMRPETIIIGTTYNGAKILIEGSIPEGADAVINVMGKRSDEMFKKKGKALGLFWMNMGNVVFHNVPNLYLVYTPKNPGDASVDFKSLLNDISISPESEDKDFLINEFIKLKAKKGLYSINNGEIRYGKASNGIKKFSCEVSLPSSLVPGVYEVTLIVLNNGRVLDTIKEPLNVIEKGIPSIVAKLAYRHSTLYGILASVIAILAGFLMGVIFKGAKGGH